jgi:hypothetical protein
MKRLPFLSLLFFVVVSLILSGCQSQTSKTTSPASAPATIAAGKLNTITLGTSVDLGSETIGSGGGGVTISKQGDPLDGLSIDVPPEAYKSNLTYKISSAPVVNHTFGKDFKVASPLITVDNGGGYAGQFITVRVPVKIPEDHLAMGFFYDSKTNKLEGMPLVENDANSITVATTHFSSFFIGMIDKAKFLDEADSGFRPGKDDWQFTNYGSCVEPGGHCEGQSMAAMWYFVTKPDGANTFLNGTYDKNGIQPKTPELWQDDSYGYRLCSVVQGDLGPSDFAYGFWPGLTGRVWKQKDGKWQWVNVKKSVSDQTTRDLFAFAIQMTGEPQMVKIQVKADTSSGGHSMVCYKVIGNTLYIADPNYPGKDDRTIQLANGSFKPYYSGANKEEIEAGRGKNYDMIFYAAKSTLIDWNRIPTRWTEFKNGTIGKDRFPEYKIYYRVGTNPSKYLAENDVINSKKVQFGADFNGTLAGVQIYRDGKKLSFDSAGNFELIGGKNNLGFAINKEVNGKLKYVDFIYINVICNGLTVSPNPLNGETGKEYIFSANLDSPLAGVKYEWYVNNELKQSSTQSTFKTAFSAAGNYTVSAWAGSSGTELGKDEAKVTIKAAAPVSTGYWQYKGTWNTEIAKNDPKYPNMTWEASASDGAVKGTLKMRDMSVDSHPWLEFTYDYSWSVSAKNGNFKDKLYPGDEITVNMTLNYKGCDPAKLSRGAAMYCGAFNNYPRDNAMKASNPAGSGTKMVTIPITAGFSKGATAFIKVHCEGGAQGIEYAYLYEWVPGTP